MKNLFVACFIFACAHGIAFAQSCDDETIDSVSNDGSIIILLAGAVYRVSEQDQVQTALWLPNSSVLVCGEREIINTDEQGERAKVIRLK